MPVLSPAPVAAPAPAAVSPVLVPSKIRTLVIDEQAPARSSLRALLLTLGIEQVEEASDPIIAVQSLSKQSFDLVLCEVRFRSQMDGAQVLEYLRTRRLLSPSAAFLLIGAAVDRTVIAQARDWQPDGFVLKPFTVATLGPRLEQALRRRRSYAPLYAAEDKGDMVEVLEQARRLSLEAGGTSVELLRWQAHALIELGRLDQVRVLCEQAVALRSDLPWVEVALAHCERAEERLVDAVARLRAAIRRHPSHGEAYDLLIDVLQDQGEVQTALEVAQSALDQLSTTHRLRVVGEIAFAQGDLNQAETCYRELIRRTATSLTRQAIDTAMLGQVYVTGGAVERALRTAQSVALDADPPTRALAAAVQAQAHTAQGDPLASLEAARRAVELAATGTPGESILLLVAQAAFGAGLRDDALMLAGRAASLRKGAQGPSALARRVLSDAGVDPTALSQKRVDETAPGQASPDANTPSDVAAALAAVHAARFDDAMRALSLARARLPHNPMVLLAAVQVQMMRMRARGFDETGAADVRACLAELDSQIPGDQRVLPMLRQGGVRD